MHKCSNKTTLTFVFIIGLVLSSPTFCQIKQQDRYVQLLQKFRQWKEQQFQKGTFARDKSCNPDTVTKEGYKGAEMGIPKDINVFFTDVNLDNKLDAIIVFYPAQCDGGNALMNTQITVIVLSKGIDYSVDDTYIDKIETELKKGWIIIEGALYGSIYGKYYEYKKSDGRCCPSISKPFSIDYKTKKLTFNKE
ncbi:MAG: hypothetical protein JWN83_1848 [Chitinophagaceae bacterium]|nr:hypothetical protein [Chitinophagaceae bacterium]